MAGPERMATRYRSEGEEARLRRSAGLEADLEADTSRNIRPQDLEGEQQLALYFILVNYKAKNSKEWQRMTQKGSEIIPRSCS